MARQSETRRFSLPAELTFPPREGGYANGRETREVIIAATMRLLVEEGYRAITMRRVAKECGLKIGNLTYHFGSREDLIRSTIEAIRLGYSVVISDAAERDDATPEQKLVDLCDFFLDDIKTKKTTMVFPELWALANHDPFVYDIVHEIYIGVIDLFFHIISELRPDLPEPARMQLSLFIQASIEGMTIFSGYQKPFHGWMDQMKAISAHSFLQLISTIQEADIPQKASIPAGAAAGA